MSHSTKTENRPAKRNSYETKKSTYAAKLETIRRKEVRKLKKMGV